MTIFVRFSVQVNVFTLTFFRFFFAFIFLSLFPQFKDAFHVYKFRKSIKYLVFLAMVACATSISYFIAIKNTNIANAVLLLYTAPIYVAILSPIFLKEKITSRILLCLILSMLGVILIIDPYALDVQSITFKGIFFGLLSGFFYSLITITSRYLKKDIKESIQTIWTCFIAILLLLPFAFYISLYDILKNLPWLILIGVFSTALSIFLYFKGLKTVPASKASIIMLLEPVCAMLLSFVFLSEVPKTVSIIGGILILSSSYILTRK